MKTIGPALPNDIAALQRLLMAAQEENRALTEENQKLRSDVTLLQEEVQFLKHRLFGRKSERLSEAERKQLLLFNEAEATVEAAGGGEDEGEEEVRVSAHTRRKRGRKALPANLPRVDVVCDVPEEQKRCGCGAEKVRIGEETSERLDIVPARIQVIREIRPKYACRTCEGVEDEGPTVVIAPPRPHLIPKGTASEGLLAFVITSKFADAIPFYRQAKQFERIGVELGRTTLCQWALQAAERCGPVLELLREEVRAGPVIRCDETTLQVLQEPGRSAQTKSYMWVFLGGPPGRPAVEYHYAPTRESRVAREYLRGYRGVVQTDGYQGYDFLDHEPDITHAGCMAHSRRRFVEAQKATGGSRGKTTAAHWAVGRIRKLYAIERRAQAQGLEGEALVRERRKHALPVLEELKAWLDKKALQVVPKSLLGKAVHYTLGQWPRLVAYVDHAFLTPDNNLAENAIRPFVVGRKNWLFSATPAGAKASAALYSLIETAKANGLEPYRYLKHVFEHVPQASTREDYRVLLPQHMPADLLAQLAPGGGL
ncbi:IS66 family transposase [Deferrisoma camini]|uniref:IS66 family transposase n=1 Tax=Deferrisoma camini TaxID=1035120 RepID=UPI00046D2293|nr:IS66 family transposase [Deferrisoma camini]